MVCKTQIEKITPVKLTSIQYSTVVPYTIKPAHEVTSIKQSPVFKGHPFLIPS